MVRKVRLSRRQFLVSAGVAGSLLGFQRSAASVLPPEVLPIGMRDAARLSIGNIALDGLTDVFPRPFEADVLRERRDLRNAAVDKICEILGDLTFRASDFSRLDFVGIPKPSGNGLRACALMQPSDTAIYLAVALLAAPAIEAGRPPPTEGIVHSYRYWPIASRGRIFDRKFGYSSFMLETSRRRAQSPFSVSCDIADFYGRIDFERVASALERAAVQPRISSFVTALLQFWSPGSKRGLPVGQQASRILAEAVLSECDRAMNEDGVRFVRFVDDFRLFADDERGAQQSLTAVHDILASSGLTLNPAKTRVLASANSPPRVRIPPPRPTGPQPYRRGALLQFRRPNRRELAGMEKPIDEAEFAACLSERSQPSHVLRRLIRHAIFGRHDKFVRAIPDLVARRPEFTIYATSALIQGRQLVSAETREAVGARLAQSLFDTETPEFGRIFILHLLADPSFAQHKIVSEYARTLAISPRQPCFRQALEALRNTGGIPADLFAFYGAADEWARRSFASTWIEGIAKSL